MLDVLLISTVCLSCPGDGGTNGDGIGSQNSSISGDGSFVAYASEATNLIPGDTNGYQDIFLHELETGALENITFGGDGDSHQPAISRSGRYVSFFSRATNLVPNDIDGISDVFVYDAALDQIERVSDDAGGRGPRVSATGRFVVYMSGDWGATGSHVILADRRAGTRVDLGPGRSPTISANGRWIGYQSDPAYRAWIYDQVTGTAEEVAPGADANCGAPTVSDDGRLVTFNSQATNIVPNTPPNRACTYLFDRALGTFAIIAEFTGSDPRITPGGSHIAVDTSQGFPDGRGGWHCALYDVAGGVLERVSFHTQGLHAMYPSVSDDGRAVAYYSGGRGTPADTNNVSDIYLWTR